MREYTPDNWVIVKFPLSDKNVEYCRVLAGWSGGYINSDAWQLNSGIVRVEENDTHYRFYGNSGSCYACHKESYMVKMNIAGILNTLETVHNVTMLDEDTDWMSMRW
jgi:hypothetical protein